MFARAEMWGIKRRMLSHHPNHANRTTKKATVTTVTTE